MCRLELFVRLSSLAWRVDAFWALRAFLLRRRKETPTRAPPYFVHFSLCRATPSVHLGAGSVAFGSLAIAGTTRHHPWAITYVDSRQRGWFRARVLQNVAE